MKILIFDLETTSLDITKSEIFEIAWVVVDRAYSIQNIYSNFCNTSEPLTEEIVKITKVDPQIVLNHGKPFHTRLHDLLNVISEHKVTHICGHNIVNYDLPVLKSNIEKTSLRNEAIEVINGLKIIDTITDLPFDYPTKKLSYIATEHGFLNPYAHRALFDVLTCLKILECYKIEDILELADSPTIEIRALVSFEKKDLAAKRSYKWDPTRKFWVKTIKQINLNKEQDQLDFAIQVL